MVEMSSLAEAVSKVVFDILLCQLLKLTAFFGEVANSIRIFIILNRGNPTNTIFFPAYKKT